MSLIIQRRVHVAKSKFYIWSLQWDVLITRKILNCKKPQSHVRKLFNNFSWSLSLLVKIFLYTLEIKKLFSVIKNSFSASSRMPQTPQILLAKNFPRKNLEICYFWCLFHVNSWKHVKACVCIAMFSWRNSSLANLFIFLFLFRCINLKKINPKNYSRVVKAIQLLFQLLMIRMYLVLLTRIVNHRVLS